MGLFFNSKPDTFFSRTSRLPRKQMVGVLEYELSNYSKRFINEKRDLVDLRYFFRLNLSEERFVKLYNHALNSGQVENRTEFAQVMVDALNKTFHNVNKGLGRDFGMVMSEYNIRVINNGLIDLLEITVYIDNNYLNQFSVGLKNLLSQSTESLSTTSWKDVVFMLCGAEYLQQANYLFMFVNDYTQEYLTPTGLEAYKIIASLIEETKDALPKAKKLVQEAFKFLDAIDEEVPSFLLSLF